MRVGDDYLLSSSPPNHPSKIKGKRFNLCSQVQPLPQAFGNEAGAPPGGPCKHNNHVRTFEAGLLLIV